MKVNIIQKEIFEFKNDFTKEKIEKSKECELVFKNDCLTIEEKSIEAAVLICGFVYLEEFSKKLIFFEHSKKGKKIIFEVENFKQDTKLIKKWIKKRNLIAVYKSPLNCDNSCKIRDSVFANTEKPADFRGLLNLFILFAILNYYRVILEHALKYGSLFNENLQIFIKMSRSDINFFIFVILFIGYIFFIYKLQIWTFKEKIDSTISAYIVLAISTIYFLTSVLLVIHLELPFSNLKSRRKFHESLHNGIPNESNILHPRPPQYKILHKSLPKKNLIQHELY